MRKHKVYVSALVEFSYVEVGNLNYVYISIVCLGAQCIQTERFEGGKLRNSHGNARPETQHVFPYIC